jgi:hypothetical protein
MIVIILLVVIIIIYDETIFLVMIFWSFLLIFHFLFSPLCFLLECGLS